MDKVQAHGSHARAHSKAQLRIANLRREQAHLFTTMLTREFGVIGVETLAVKNLKANRRLARHISDAGWGTILAQLEYKKRWSAGVLMAAGRFFPSSKTCSACGAVRAKLSLSERVFTCHNRACGHVQDRDLNAALNLARIAAHQGQFEGEQCYVAATGAETPNARGGQIRLDPVEPGPKKREVVPTLIPERPRAALATSKP